MRKHFLHFSQLESEPNLWRVEESPQEEGATKQLRGLLMTYVDDIFIAAEGKVLSAFMSAIRQKWTTSTPDTLSEVPICFLGMEVSKKRISETGREEWFVTQESFVRDLLQKDGEEIKKRKILIKRDQSVMPAEAEENRTPESVREAQKAVSRQQLVALSTAESKMMEVVPSMMAGESIAVIAVEVFSDVIRRVSSDSQAAVSILTNEGGNWRTCHLRMRAAAARQAIARGDWALQHQIGESMIADVGTKALASTRLEKVEERYGHEKKTESRRKRREERGGAVKDVDGS
eukprot:s3627_g5.t1